MHYSIFLSRFHPRHIFHTIIHCHNVWKVKSVSSEVHCYLQVSDTTMCPGMGRACCVNSLAPGRSECDSKSVIFKLVLLISSFRSSHDNSLRWMPQDLTDNKSTLVQVMAWCRQATSHYLSQCWLSSLSPYGVARPEWVNQSFILKDSMA